MRYGKPTERQTLLGGVAEWSKAAVLKTVESRWAFFTLGDYAHLTP